MGTFGGIAIVVVIVLVAGLIAYIGDRVGHQVGRKRMTLFGLRPKYTSTIVAVGTGMMIALVATVVTLSSSPYARNAFFHLQAINNKVNELQAEADALDRVRNQNLGDVVVLARGDVVYNQFLVITPQESTAQRVRDLTAFFTAVVEAIDRRYVSAGLKPYPHKASDPEIQEKLRAELDDQTVQGFLLRGPVLLVAVADRNYFVNDPLGFTFAAYADQPIFRNRQAISSVEVDGGTDIVPTVAFSQLASAIRELAIARGMPAFFANVFTAPSPDAVRTMRRAIAAGRGRYYIIARAAGDVYPHTGNIPVTFSLGRSPR